MYILNKIGTTEIQKIYNKMLKKLLQKIARNASEKPLYLAPAKASKLLQNLENNLQKACKTQP